MNKIFLFFIILLYSCQDNINTNHVLSEKLKTITEYHIRNNLELILKLDTITDFEWNYFFVLPPYSRVEEVGKRLNINLNNLNKTGIKSRDDICVLVFIKNNQLISYCEHTRLGDFSELNKVENVKLFTPETAIFKLENRGVRHYVFVEF